MEELAKGWKAVVIVVVVAIIAGEHTNIDHDTHKGT